MLPSLNPAQREAVEHGEGPLLVLAGAGSGKTRVLTARVARLLEEGVPPERVLAVTFTNRAAREMEERIAELAGAPPRGLWTSTFHSLAARLLRREARHGPRDRNFTIYDRDDSLRAVRVAMEESGVDPERWSARAVRARISEAKNALVGPAEFDGGEYDLMGRRVAEVYPLYERALARSNALDFDDLLVHAVRLLEGVEVVRRRYATRFRHVLVDEYQDTNHAQYRMVRVLAEEHGNLCVVGDDDQSIYGWRGAEVRNILDFERDFPGARVVRLERNYRSTGSILRVANHVIAHNSARKPKELFTAREDGEPIRVVRLADEKEEARWTVRRVREMREDHPPGDVAVLYRTNAQSRPYEEALRRADVPYRIVGGVRFYERREIRDVLAYLKLAVNPADDAAFERAVNWPRRGIGKVTRERLSEARRPEESLIAAAARARKVEGIPSAGARALETFASEIDALHQAQRSLSAPEAFRAITDRFGLRAALEAEEGGEERLENVDELAAGVSEFDPAEVEEERGDASELELFVQHVTLLTDVDRVELGEGAVSLMTLHNAKGLEFPVVFIGGLEKGLFPLARAHESPEEYEEERRLFYVGVTRARERLFLTHAAHRWRAGSARDATASPFLDELPAGPVERRRASPGGTAAGAPSATTLRDGKGAKEDFSWRRSVGSGDDLTYDYADSQEPLELSEGARVIHARFGSGTIRALSREGRRTKLEIEFDEGGRKKVVLGHGGLRPA